MSAPWLKCREPGCDVGIIVQHNPNGLCYEHTQAENARLAQTVEELRNEVRAEHEAHVFYKRLSAKRWPAYLAAHPEEGAASEPEAKTVTDQLGNRFHRLTASEPEAEQGD